MADFLLPFGHDTDRPTGSIERPIAARWNPQPVNRQSGQVSANPWADNPN
jgi:hypothetical protein